MVISSSAASAALAILVLGGPDQSRQLLKEEQSAFKSVRKTAVTLLSNGHDKGVAVCIDSKRGLFMVHSNAVTFPKMFGRTPAGRIVEMSLKSSDEVSQMALLQMNPAHWIEMPSVKLSAEPKTPYPRLFAVLPSGPIPVEMVSTERIAVLGDAKRVIPVIEVRFEASLDRVGGAPVFTSNGELVGILNATLKRNEMAPAMDRSSAAKIESKASGGAGYSAQTYNSIQFGPQSLTVGFAVGPSVLGRVSEGFLSPDQRVVFPALGVMLADWNGSGAEVRSVNLLSVAESAGVKAGDIIVEVAGKAVRNQIDYVKAMAEQKIGSTIVVKVQRGADVVPIEITLK